MAYFIDGEGCKYPLDDKAESITIGRAGDLKISEDYAESGVSRKHAKVFHGEGKWGISDTGSHFGTYLNAERIDPDNEYDIVDGNIVTLGRYPLVFREEKPAQQGNPP